MARTWRTRIVIMFTAFYLYLYIYIQGVPKKSIPFEMKPLLEVNALLLCWTHGCVKKYTFWNQAFAWIWMPYYYAEVTYLWVQHSNKAFTSNKGFISKGILFFGTPCIYILHINTVLVLIITTENYLLSSTSSSSTILIDKKYAVMATQRKYLTLT